MKAKIVFLTSVTCAILLATQIAKPPQAISKPSCTQPSIPQFSECLISDFPSMDKGKADKEVPLRTVTPPQEVESSKTSVVPEKIAKTSTQAKPFLSHQQRKSPYRKTIKSLHLKWVIPVW
ncbi:hypothetical protein [Oscillibacter sp. GMB15532]|uniref:hypothetical protein n=1 Tax=Oscillibacter sp. GMB15532 TaxID=3230022 RepID=UPI0034DEDF27